jgi:hypothetical protein
MSVTFRTLRQKAYYGSMLSTDYMAEDARYKPKGGSYVPIIVSIVATEDPILDDNDMTINRTEEIIVQCTKDAYAENQCGKELGGIRIPKIGDKLLRNELRDPLQIPYTFVRQMQDDTEIMWRLVFRRSIRGSQGVSV